MFLIAALTALVLGKPVIGWLARIRARQTIYAYAPETHRPKEGTPTMGGFLIILGVLVAMLAWGVAHRGENLVLALVIFAGALWFAAIGLLDDYGIRQLTGQRGLEWKAKLGLQLVAAAVSVYILWQAIPAPTREMLTQPFASDRMGLLALEFGWGYYLLAVLWVVGWVNAFNLTDGLDGLAAGLTAIAFLPLCLEVERFTGAEYAPMLVGACVGYLWWNVYPARVFMGDTGSMFLGASFGLLTLRMLLSSPSWTWIASHALIGGVFAVEILSVVIQLSSVKLRGGKRVFKATPIHHHFELLGWSEPTIVMRFWLVGALCAGGGLLVSRL
ncbi:MAG: phospho-N-acetylmuramoyl-pentapeptide-transferase [Armatimonadetes bacterium JP3_11]|nr:MAG: phospho-N-acetylmuramoyl-pentapeptide-transferase [Armatimonadetes bacterium CP1_7O]OYT74539.1 MAG: phospho-N-acetylmuramoyl-pentapeptide-transferase [Armatimonadetes bacterium JP3_11]RMH06211.1 MAG: phospho-N-acetylmuramoyl-pentapeptide-transferase [Armatimonadota bacterium]